ncbi:hypothetical protein PBI_LUCKY2013_146 [Mycobacterium phage Lucky2013]|uniref:hypothetical protein n=1 Tax=Mycobacterium phage MiaZeal TaxID=1567005 RepID=UPI0005413242|nr:hypothetical protein AVV70_gp153 [Mycobacterium phage MiaZeal]AIY32507.1 hypothetical protein PBI_MIAZEAL_153 [Mycobacterium phage MiaZeal]ASD50768.1 hypothetical protein PORCELAIN_150 [Mycobacterium phage Porcelain]ASD53539.1 hypothetical protein PBI_LUCKY2013_146 [Mycobacterium phage Lucky2013]
MTLYVDFRVNSRPIANLAISRVKGCAAPDSLNTYTWHYTEPGTDEVDRGDIQHRYGDGAPALVEKICAQLRARGIGVQ